jgi:hypothetical protein
MNEKILQRIDALLHHTDPEVRWLAGYASRLTRAAGLVANHLQRIADPQFRPRQQLEKALEG